MTKLEQEAKEYINKKTQKKKLSAAQQTKLRVKECDVCGETKPLSDYYRNKKDDYYFRSCKPCNNKRTWSRRDHKKQRDQKLKQNFGITLEDFNTMAEAQGRCCAICNTHEDNCHRGTLYVDHCHNTQKVRSLLCHHCNLGLGHFKDDINKLKAAIKYLEANNED